MTCATKESRFTKPHAACKHPEWWHAPDSDSTETEVTLLIAALVRATQPEYVVETGTAFGYTALAIADAVLKNGHGRFVSLEVDPVRRDAALELIRSKSITREIPNVIELRLQDSGSFTPEQDIGFALFDSLYELRKEEFLRYKPWLKPGTIVTFHDTTSGLRGHYMDVRAEVESLADDGLLNPIYIPSPRGLAIAEVL